MGLEFLARCRRDVFASVNIDEERFDLRVQACSLYFWGILTFSSRMHPVNWSPHVRLLVGDSKVKEHPARRT